MYGSAGPLSYQTGYAPCFAALGGVSALVGYEGEPPTGMNVRYADSTFGTMAAYAAVVALLHRLRTGVGQSIDVSAVECMSSMISDTIMDYTLNGVVRHCDGNRHPEMTPHGVYPCREGEWLCIAVESDAQWCALAAAMGQPELADDPRFNSHAERKANEEELDRRVSEWTGQREAAPTATELQAAGVAASKSQSSLDLIADHHLWARGFYREVADCEGQTKTTLAPPWRMTRGAEISAAAPRLGEHNAYVFGEILGRSEAEQRALAAAGITR
jgi:crotonobetainyl-CoA:carnitine CoA-transferase CaiB-like acyl-CoA transferase